MRHIFRLPIKPKIKPFNENTFYMRIFYVACQFMRAIHDHLTKQDVNTVQFKENGQQV